MHRAAAVIALLLLSGCGSCLDDEKASAVEAAPTATSAAVKTIARTTEAGQRRPVIVADGVTLSGLMKRDGGARGTLRDR